MLNYKRAGNDENIPPAIRSWLFALTILPFGAFTGFISTALPFLLGSTHVPIDTLSRLSAIALIPTTLFFLWTPVIEVGFTYRTWLMVMSAITAVVLCYIILHIQSLAFGMLAAILTFGSATNQLIACANGALMASYASADTRGRVAGWLQGGNLAGGTFIAGMLLWLSSRIPQPTLAYLAAIVTFLPSLVVLLIPRFLRSHDRPITIRSQASFVRRELPQVLKSRSCSIGLVYFLSPVGAAGASYLLSAVGVDYHASSETVIYTSGLVGGLITGIGALAGGYICDRVDRSLAYIGAGVLLALAAATLALGPLTVVTYVVGVLMYLLASGASYAAFGALALDLIGISAKVPAVQFAIYVAAVSLSTIYMTALDGEAHKLWGARGLFAADAVLATVGVITLVLAKVVSERHINIR